MIFMEQRYITITGLGRFMGTESARVGKELMLRKEPDNAYDDETIVVESDKGVRYGYVANSVGSVARGTQSAGRIYDTLKEGARCTIRFVLEDKAIASLE